MQVWQSNSQLFGISLRIISGIGFALMTALIKYVGDAIPLGEVVFFRSAFALFPIGICLLFTKNFPQILKTQYLWKHLTHCLMATLGMFFAFATLRYLPLAESTAISYLCPLFIMILALLFLQEHINAQRWLGLAFGLAGLTMMTLPSFSVNANGEALIGIGLGLLSALLIAGAMLQMRQLSRVGENAAVIALYFVMTSTIIGALTMLNNWQTPTLSQLFMLIIIGLLGGVAQLLMILAYKYAEASALAPYEYLAILWSVLFGFIIFSEIPDMVFWLAMPLIVLGAMIAKPSSKSKPELNNHRL